MRTIKLVMTNLNETSFIHSVPVKEYGHMGLCLHVFFCYGGIHPLWWLADESLKKKEFDIHSIQVIVLFSVPFKRL